MAAVPFWTSHLSKAAEHLFGKGSEQAKRWFRKRRHKLRHEPGAVGHLLHSISYHRRKLRTGTLRYEDVSKELRFFRNNGDKMDYATYRAGKRLAKPHVRSAAPIVDYGGSWRCGLVRELAERSRDQL